MNPKRPMTAGARNRSILRRTRKQYGGSSTTQTAQEDQEQIRLDTIEQTREPTEVVFGLYASSKTSLGARNKNADNNRFTVDINEDFQIPRNAYRIRMTLRSAAVWNVVPNIITGVNDQICIQIGAVQKNFIFPQGTYGIAELNETLNIQGVAARRADPSFLWKSHGAGTDGDEDGQSVVFVGNIPDGKVHMRVARFEIPGNPLSIIQVKWTDLICPNGFQDLIGFDHTFFHGNNNTALEPYENFLGATRATLTAVDFLQLSCSLVSEGIRTNGVNKQIIGKIDMTAAPGHLVNHLGGQSLSTFAPNLAGQAINTVTFELLDDELKPIIMPEEWHVGIEISYLV